MILAIRVQPVEPAGPVEIQMPFVVPAPSQMGPVRPVQTVEDAFLGSSPHALSRVEGTLTLRFEHPTPVSEAADLPDGAGIALFDGKSRAMLAWHPVSRTPSTIRLDRIPTGEHVVALAPSPASARNGYYQRRMITIAAETPDTVVTLTTGITPLTVHLTFGNSTDQTSGQVKAVESTPMGHLAGCILKLLRDDDPHWRHSLPLAPLTTFDREAQSLVVPLGLFCSGVYRLTIHDESGAMVAEQQIELPVTDFPQITLRFPAR